VVGDGYLNYASAAFAPRSLTTEQPFSGANVLMPDEHPFTLRQVDLAGTDFAAIEDHLDFLKAQLARIPTRKEQARTGLGIMLGAAGLVLAAGGPRTELAASRFKSLMGKAGQGGLYKVVLDVATEAAKKAIMG